MLKSALHHKGWNPLTSLYTTSSGHIYPISIDKNATPANIILRKWTASHFRTAAKDSALAANRCHYQQGGFSHWPGITLCQRGVPEIKFSLSATVVTVADQNNQLTMVTRVKRCRQYILANRPNLSVKVSGGQIPETINTFRDVTRYALPENTSERAWNQYRGTLTGCHNTSGYDRASDLNTLVNQTEWKSNIAKGNAQVDGTATQPNPWPVTKSDFQPWNMISEWSYRKPGNNRAGISSPVLSIIIAVHNSEDYILTCLESLDRALSADCAPAHIEAIIVNDGSTDDSLRLINTYPAKHFNKKVYSVNFHNVGRVKKFAFSHSSGEYITILDSDDAFKQGALSWILSRIEALNFDILITPLEEVYGFLYIQNIEVNGTEKHLDKNTAKNLYLNHKVIKGHIAGKFIRRSCLSSEMFPESVCYEDMVTVAHAIHKAEKIIYTDTHCYQYRKRQNSLSDDKTGEKILLIVDALEKIERFFIENAEQRCIFDAMLVKSISDFVSRSKVSKLPARLKRKINEIDIIKFILCSKVRFSRKRMYLALKVRFLETII